MKTKIDVDHPMIKAFLPSVLGLAGAVLIYPMIGLTHGAQEPGIFISIAVITTALITLVGHWRSVLHMKRETIKAILFMVGLAAFVAIVKYVVMPFFRHP